MKKVFVLFAFVCAFSSSLSAQVQIKNGSAGTPLIFFMVDNTDHISGKTGLTPTVTISKNGAAFAAPSGAVTELANGWYKVAGNATDSNTNGILALHASASGADPTDKEAAIIVAYDPNDSVRIGITALPNAAAAAAGGLLTAGAGANQLSTSGGNVALTSAGNQAIWDVTSAAQTSAGALGKRIVDDLTGDIYARLGTPAAGSISADIAAAKADTAAIKAKTDQFAFTVPGKVNANTQYVEDQALSAKAGDNFNFFFQDNGGTTTAIVDDVAAAASGAADWTSTERQQLRYRLGIDGAVNVPVASPTLPVTAAVVSDKTGYSLSSAGIDAIHDDSLANNTTAGTLGKFLNDLNTNVPGIKTKTDQFAFTVPNKVDSNAQYIEGQSLSGKVGDNLNTFFQNGGANTAKIVDDVSGGGGGGTGFTATELNQLRYRLGIDGSTAVPTATPNLNLYTYQKNVAGQKVGLIFFNASTGAVQTNLLTSDISCVISKDFGAAVATNDTTEAEVGNGLYTIDLTQAETNANVIYLYCTATGARPYTALLFTQH